MLNFQRITFLKKKKISDLNSDSKKQQQKLIIGLENFIKNQTWMGADS